MTQLVAAPKQTMVYNKAFVAYWVNSVKGPTMVYNGN